MVTQGGYAHLSAANATNVTDAYKAIMVDWFRNEVKWFAIYSCILGAVMLIGTYLAIVLFNIAAHSQVSGAHRTHIKPIEKWSSLCKMRMFKRFSEYEASFSKLFSIKI